MEKLMPLFGFVKVAINIFSIAILVFGVVLCLINLVKIGVAKQSRVESMLRIQQVKAQLGVFVLLGLEILIVADIIETVLRPTLNDILLLAAIVAIRTVISFFLNMEIREIQKQDSLSDGPF